MLADHYLQIKAMHVLMVQTSFAFFIMRGLLMLCNSSVGMHPAVRYATYLIDMTLLAAAILLLVVLQLNPLTTTWIAAKLVLLIFYIVLGSIALKRGRTKMIRTVAYLSALTVFTMIYMIARKHDVIFY